MTVADPRLEPAPAADYLTGVAARELARKIEAYWHAQSHLEVRCWVEFVVACVKFSNMAMVIGSYRSRPPVSVAAVAARRIDRLQFLEVELGDEEVSTIVETLQAPNAGIPERGKCLWPIGEPGDRDFRWCGCRVARPPSPYCRKHVAAARHRPGCA